MKISIVIPNWNGYALLKKHLATVLSAADGSQVIIVDDASTDDSVRFLKTNFPSVVVIEQREHLGFASTVNKGVEKAKGDIIILLNTDVEPDKDFIKPLTKHFDDKNVFAVGCMDKSMEKGKMVERGRGVARWHRGFYVHSRGEVTSQDTAWVSGGSGAFRKLMWQKLGGMDTLFNPFYWEDIDLSYRARKAGWQTVFEPKSVVTHFHEEGKILKEYTPQTIKEIAYRNQFLFIWKNVTDSSIFFMHVFWTPIRLFQSLANGDIAFIKGYFRALSKIPQVIIHRHRSLRLYVKSDGEL